MPTCVNLDGRIVPLAEAVVSVFDRGFLYGDSVYEVVRTYDGEPFELDAHLGRLARSAHRIGLELPWDAQRTASELLRTLDEGQGGEEDLEKNDLDAAPWNRGERSARIVMTHGSGELDPVLASAPRAILIVRPLRGPTQTSYSLGVKACLVGPERTSMGIRAGAGDPAAKTGNHLANVLALREARAEGAEEALLVDGSGFVTEGASSNLFMVRAGRLETTPLAAGILEGVTRGVVLALAREAGLTTAEVPLRPEDLAQADELFVTSTAREILPVTALGAAVVGNGAPGPVTSRLHALFRARAQPIPRKRTQ